MQADQVALFNFASREFTTELNEVSEQKPSLLPAVALLDAGATFTSLILVSRESFWFWSIENGGEDLTTALARGTRVAHREAEELKRFPARIEFRCDSYLLVESRLDELRVRLQKLVAEATSQNGRFEVLATWCLGGAPPTHAWIRRVL